MQNSEVIDGLDQYYAAAAINVIDGQDWDISMSKHARMVSKIRDCYVKNKRGISKIREEMMTI